MTRCTRCIALALFVGLSTTYSVDNAIADHSGHAIQLAEQGDLPGAIASYRAAVHFGATSEALFNLAIALLDERHVPDDARATRGEALVLLQEALQKNPGNEAARELMHEIRGAPCAEENLRYTLDAQDHTRGQLSRDTLARLTQTFSDCGVVLLSGAMNGKHADFFKQLQAAQGKLYQRLLDQKLHKADAEERSKGRFEIRTPFEEPFVSTELLDNEYIHGLASSFLATGRTEIDTLSSVVSQPHTKAQHWHRDTAMLWNDRVVDGKTGSLSTSRRRGCAKTKRRRGTRPSASSSSSSSSSSSTSSSTSSSSSSMPSNSSSMPHGVVVFMPLVDVTMREGPTEFLLRSHIQCDKRKEVQLQLPDLDVNQNPAGGSWTCDECPWSTERFVAMAKAGDAILFDVRILHRGGKNVTPQPRPMMYFSYAQEWWVDAVNFHPRQTRRFDRFNTRMRKLVTRLDSREYTQLIESKLQEMGVDIQALQSKYNYKRVSLKEFGVVGVAHNITDKKFKLKTRSGRTISFG